MAAAADEASLILGRAHLERFRDGRRDGPGGRPGRRSCASIRQSCRHATAWSSSSVWARRCISTASSAPRRSCSIRRLSPPGRIESAGRDGLLDWWADSLERYAATGPTREGVYVRMLRRMEEETQRDTRSLSASYWLVVAAHGVGDLDRAWDVAIAAWVGRLRRVRGPSNCVPIWTAT